MARKLATTRRRWRRRAPFQFWQHELGVLVELDRPDHDKSIDAVHERAAFYERGVMVIHVEEFSDKSAAEALRAIRYTEPWNSRRRALGLTTI
jgi:hypothetical protein